jgi:hypothetical protein
MITMRLAGDPPVQSLHFDALNHSVCCHALFFNSFLVFIRRENFILKQMRRQKKVS